MLAAAPPSRANNGTFGLQHNLLARPEWRKPPGEEGTCYAATTPRVNKTGEK